MNKIFFIFFIFLQNFSFAQIDSVQQKMLEERKTMAEEIRKQYTSRCNEDRERAIADSKIKTVYYVNIPAPDGEEFLQEKEFSEILKKQNIIFGGTWMGSDIAGYYPSQKCYFVKMTKFAEEKFGEKFFDEKMDEALQLYVKNNPDKIFDYRRNEMDLNPILYGITSKDEQENYLKSSFWQQFKLPNGYIKRKEGELYSYLYAGFILDQKGNISGLEIEAEIHNKENIRFKNRLDANFKKYIQSLKWQPSTYKGYQVKNIESITIYLP